MSMNGTENINPVLLKQLEQMKKRLLGTILDHTAYERLARVRLVDEQLAERTELYLLQAYQTGKLKNRVTDVQLKEMLGALSEKKDFTITRK
jgi:DNA-binding TFAR19-related protein (PDSD5 family)